MWASASAAGAPRVLDCASESPREVCAETPPASTAAIAAAVTLYGPDIRIRAVAVVNLNGAACMPCGACRQTIFEFADAETAIFYPSATGETISTTLSELLPAAFRLASE